MREKLSFGFRIWSILLVASLLFGLIPATLARAVSSDNTEETVWKLADPANLTTGKSYIVVSENGALTNAQVLIATPGDVTGDTQLGMATTPVSIDNGVITSKVNADMIWQFGPGKNSAEADAEADNLGEGGGYQLFNQAPGEKAGILPLRRESSFNAQHAPLNTTGAALNDNQQSILVKALNDGTGAASLYIWGGSGAWNFAVIGMEDGFTAKAPAASASTGTELSVLMQDSKLWLYEADEEIDNQHYVLASAAANGTIVPTSLAKYVWVTNGEDLTFTFTPSFGYELDTVTVDGADVTEDVVDNTYTMKNITASGIEIMATFKAVADAVNVTFDVYNDIFGVGNVTTAVIIDLGEGKAAKLADLDAGMFSVNALNTRLDGTTLVFEGDREISRVYVNDEPKTLGYILPAPGSDNAVTGEALPQSGRYIVIELAFWSENGYMSGAMASGNLQNAFSTIMNYSINANNALKLADENSLIPLFVQNKVLNPVLDQFVHDVTVNADGTTNMNILIAVDDAWATEGALPLFIYNHGGGRGGANDDFFAPLQTANAAAMLAKLQLENPGKYHAHIIATQNHVNEQANNEALIAYIQQMAEEGKVDLNRIYMSGFSMGSGYTLGFYMRNPEFLAAIAPLAGGTLPTEEELNANPEYGKTSIWCTTHKDDRAGTPWTEYFSVGAGAAEKGLYQNANCNVVNTNRAFNFPFFGFDWTPHETEAQNYTNLIGQQDALHRFGPSQETYADKLLFDWLFDQSRE